MVKCIHCGDEIKPNGLGPIAVTPKWGEPVILDNGDRIHIFNCRINGEWHGHEGAE